MFRIDEITACLNLPEAIKDKSISINTHGNCVILYIYKGCLGNFRVFTPDTGYHDDFTMLGFERGPRSIQMCNYNCGLYFSLSELKNFNYSHNY